MVPRKDARGSYWDVETFYMKEPEEDFTNGVVPRASTHLCLPMNDEEAIFRVKQLLKIYVGDYASTEKETEAQNSPNDEAAEGYAADGYSDAGLDQEEEIPGFEEAASTTD